MLALLLSAGLILPKPTPPAGLSTNYVQGAGGYLLNGEIVLIANAGNCCHGKEIATWEGIYALDSSGWHPLIGADDWGASPERDEHEMAYPAMGFVHGTYVLAYGSTCWSTDGQNLRVNIGAAFSRIPPYRWPIRWSTWIRPLGPATWGVVPIGFVGDSLWAYDGSAKLVLRYDIDGQFRPWLNPLVSVFEGRGRYNPPELTDIARRQDGSLVALAGLSHVTEVVEEWESPAIFGQTGRWWRKTGRTWSWPGSAVFDCGYTKLITGELVAPGAVICNVAPLGAYADSGLWELRWWGDPDFAPPPAWAGHRLRRVAR